MLFIDVTDFVAIILTLDMLQGSCDTSNALYSQLQVTQNNWQPAPLDARPTADTVVTKFLSHSYIGQAFEGLS